MSAAPIAVKGWCPGALQPMPSGDGLIVRIKPFCGALSLDQARGLAETAQRLGNGHIDLTRRANLQIRGLAEADLRPALEGIGLGGGERAEDGIARTAPGLLGSLVASSRFRLGRRRRRRRTLAWLAERGVTSDSRAALARLAERRAAIEQQIRVLAPFQRLFRYWHAFHLPLAVVMFLILLVHVAVAVAFGYVWTPW